jgi:putative membrane protein insertion efficiency factor
MVTVRLTWLLLLAALITQCSVAQYKSDLDIIAGVSPAKDSLIISSKTPDPHRNGFSLLAIGAIRLYQRHISSQDMPVCIFIPSCSEYGTQAIRSEGFILGSVMIADRLQRCNAMAREYYLIDPKTQRCIDPVSHNLLFK